MDRIATAVTGPITVEADEVGPPVSTMKDRFAITALISNSGLLFLHFQ